MSCILRSPCSPMSLWCRRRGKDQLFRANLFVAKYCVNAPSVNVVYVGADRTIREYSL